MTDLAHVHTFWQNADAHAAFLQRVAAALVEVAQVIRASEPPDPITGLWQARQRWASQALNGASGALAAARQMLPALAVKANDAGLLDSDGTITATDAQIRGILANDWIDMFAGYVAE